MERLRLAVVLLPVLTGCSVVTVDPGTEDEDSRYPTDLVGNKTQGSCSWDYECAADQGLVCRPDDAIVRKGWSYSKSGILPNDAFRCLPRAGSAGVCEENGDCAEGMQCWKVWPIKEHGVCDLPGVRTRGEWCGDIGQCASGLVCRPDNNKMAEYDLVTGNLDPLSKSCLPPGEYYEFCVENEDCLQTRDGQPTNWQCVMGSYGEYGACGIPR
jgi:hypothetical protein